MTRTDRSARDSRVLVLTPTSRDAALTQSLLSSSKIDVHTCQSFDDLIVEIRSGAAAILLPEEALTPNTNGILRVIMEAQPPWSDMPILVLARSGADSPALTEAVSTLGNVTLLERPLRITTLVTAIRTAVRARERQYQIRGYLAESARAEYALRLADQRKDEFIATLGHELRNPLAPLATGLHLLKQSDGPTDPVVEVMERQVNHLIRLVDDLLEVSRITRGLIEVRSDPVDLSFVIRSAIETSRPAIESARHKLSVQLPSDPISVIGDSVRLTQVFANILTNAAKYTNAGGEIWLTVTRDDADVTVSIKDNGIGIPPEHLSSVFDMFTQVNRSSRRTQGGLGIGLTLVRSLIEMHGGHVEARSDGPGRGSEFVVRLPAAATVPAHTSPAITSTQKPLTTRVLIVDDNRDAADMLANLLGRLGSPVRAVHGGEAALLALDAFRPEAILLDIGMPDMDGYSVARSIRRHPQHRHTLLIALTGWGQEQDQVRARAAGFDHHLIKPPNMDRLRELLEAARIRVAGGLQAAGRPAG
jgi:signal transduction histidine kinase/ActR/RegA family two-component response regulator